LSFEQESAAATAAAAAAAAVPDTVRLVPGSSSSRLLRRGSSMRSYSFSGGECLSPTAAATAAKAAVMATAHKLKCIQFCPCSEQRSQRTHRAFVSFFALVRVLLRL
jgi:hypothetical protein